MSSRSQRLLAGVAVAAVCAWFKPAVSAVAAQAPGKPAQAAAYSGPRTSDGKPDWNGIWQVLSTANWNLEPQSPEEGVPGGQGVVEGGTIPYQPWALKKRQENYAQRATADPLSKCYLPGVPRITYVPLPFEITQTPKYVVMAYAYAHARRIIYTDGSPHVEALEFWMGDSRGKWEGDTLVVSTNNFTDKTWFDKAGNFHSTALQVIERYSPRGPNHINYEATIEDSKVFTRPWKISMLIYRVLEPGQQQLLDYDCVSFFWKRALTKK
jgi:hypothetical protein